MGAALVLYTVLVRTAYYVCQYTIGERGGPSASIQGRHRMAAPCIVLRRWPGDSQFSGSMPTRQRLSASENRSCESTVGGGFYEVKQ